MNSKSGELKVLLSVQKTKPQHSLFYCYAAAGLMSVGIFFYFLWLAQTRNVDGDEGLYLEAARLVSQGKRLYWDFFYQQMPLLPYLYAGWMKLFGFTLYSARWLSSFLTALTGFVTLLYIARTTKNLAIVYIGGILLFANGVLLAWAPVVKTHPLNMFCLTASAIGLLDWKDDAGQPLWKIALAALLIGIGLNARLLLIAFVPVYLLFIFFKSTRVRWKNCGIFTLIVGVISLPTFYYFLADPDQFIRYNFVYHTSIYPGFIDADKRLEIAGFIFPQIHFFILLLMVQIGILLSARKGWGNFVRSNEGFLSILLVVFFVIHIGAAALFTQYFSAAVPLLVLATIPFIQWIVEPFLLSKTFMMGGLLILYLIFSPYQKALEITTMGTDDPLWELTHIESTVQAVQGVVKSGEECLTWWPGYAFMAGCASIPGMENHMRNHAIETGVPGEIMETYKMLSDEKLVEYLKQKRYRVLIDGVYRKKGPLDSDIEYFIWENYRLVEEAEGVKIYVAGASSEIR